jgi:hypothetical protein
LTLSPYLTNGFWGDDSINSSIAGVSAQTGQSICNIAKTISLQWVKNEGRFSPLGWIIGYHSYYFFQDVEHFRLYQTTLTVLQMGLFAWLVFELAGNLRFACFATLIAPLFFQVRQYHDPIGAYGGLCQYMGSIFAGSGLLVSKYSRSHRAWQLALACLIYVAGLLMYELTLVALPLLWFVLPPKASVKRKLSVLWPFLLLTSLYLVTTLWLRHAAGGGHYPGTTASLDWNKWLVTFGRQLFAAVPFSYWTAIWHNQLDVETIARRTFGSWSGWFVFGGNLVLFRVLLPTRAAFYPEGFRLRGGTQLFAVGLVLLVCPAAMIAVAKKYQDQLVWGVGYLPVYISYFGLALLAALGLYWLYAHVTILPNRYRRTLLVSFAIVTSVLVAGNRTINDAVADRMNIEFKNPRDLVEAAAQAGVFAEMADGDVLLSSQLPNWLNDYFLMQHTKRALKLIDRHAIKHEALKSLLTTHPNRVFLLHYHNFDQSDRGWLMLTRLKSQDLSVSNLKRLNCKLPALDYLVFVKSDREHPAVQQGAVKLATVDIEGNLLRRVYAASRARRYFALGKTVGDGLTPCPNDAGELEAVDKHPVQLH